MSVQALAWVLEHSEASGSDRLVLIAVANHIGGDPGEGCWPSLDTIAREARVSRRTAQRSLDALADLGELEVVRHGGQGRGDRRPNLYRLPHLRGDRMTPRGAVDEGCASVANPAPHGVTSTPRGDNGVSTATPRGDTGVTLTVSEPLEPSSSHPHTTHARSSTARGGDDDPRFAEAVGVLAARRLRRRLDQGARIGDHAAWLAKTRRNATTEHGDEAARLVATYPAITAAQLADVLDGQRTILGYLDRAEAS